MQRREEPKAIVIAGKRYERIRHGSEADGRPGYQNCPDCGVARGAVHWTNCDQEKCPRCAAQLISCRCFDQETRHDH